MLAAAMRQNRFFFVTKRSRNRRQTMTVILRCPRSCAGLEGWSRVRACCHPSRLASLAPQDDAVSQWSSPLVLEPSEERDSRRASLLLPSPLRGGVGGGGSHTQ